MDTEQAYNAWAAQYDTNLNKTRDLEAVALRTTLENISFDRCLEIGCGTGKNTVWLVEKTKQVTAVDLSAEMMAKAKAKLDSTKVEFKLADITQDWSFINGQYDLVSFSLILEHIDDLDSIFKKAAAALNQGGYIYIGELHPFKQYNGSKARFETAQGVQVVPCFNHHITDFLHTAKKHGFLVVNLEEYFDEDNRNEIPRLLILLLQKNNR